MRRFSVILASLGFASVSVLAPVSPAAAATSTFGNVCEAVNADSSTFVMTAGNAGNPIPALAPSDGVAVKARFELPDIDDTFPTKVKIMRSLGSDNYRTLRESTPLNVTGGTTAFDIRLPVSAGDNVGLFGTPGTVYCTTGAGDAAAVLTGQDLAAGQSGTFSQLPGYALPVVLTVEPDVDRDGYGDVTQDQCPESKQVQSKCPKLILDTFIINQKGERVLFLLAASNKTKVKVTAKAKLAGKTYKFKPKSKKVKSGRIAYIRFKLPPVLRAANVRRGQQVVLTFISTAKSISGKKVRIRDKLTINGER